MSQKKYPITLFLTIWLGIFVCPLCLPAWRDINSFYMITNVSISHNSTNNSNGILTSGSNEMDLSKLLPVFRMSGNSLINARDLHKALGSKQEFRHWIKDRISRCDLIENEEYIVIEYDYVGNLLNNRQDKNILSDNQRVAKRDYGFTFDACKEVAMVENNAIGKKIRRYFIEKEKESKPRNLPEALRSLANQLEENERLSMELEKNKILVEHERQEKDIAVKTLESKQRDIDFSETFEKIGENDMLIREVAKKLEQNGVITAEKSLREFLIAIHFFTQDSGRGKWELTARMVGSGYARYRSYYIDAYSGEEVHTQTVYVTGKGYKWILAYILGKGRKLFLSMKGNRIKAS